MRRYFLYCWGLMLAFLCHLTTSIPASQVYIAYMGHNHAQNPRLTSKSHVKFLSHVFSSEDDAKKSLLYSYKRSFSGFAASLNSSQANALAKTNGVISVFRSASLKLHTTRSWDFMGLNLREKKEVTSVQLTYGKNIVVGIFDTGIWPEAQSFQDDSNLGPVPSSWRGKCIAGDQFDPASACNKKLIGARFYVKGFEQEFGPLKSAFRSEYRSARDFIGHGTHTASTAVGSVVRNASFFSFGQGAARGGAPLARLAVYKVCWSLNFDGICTEADILAAFDDALNDGVHTISASFGSSPPLAPFFASSADIGSFHAMQLGVTVVFSAGNDGPGPSLVQNVAPWSICIAASSIDRAFPAKISLDNNLTIIGQGLIRKKVTGKLVSAMAYFAGGVCSSGNWNRRRASGKIILCFSTIGSLPSSEIAVEAARRANATALIYVEPLSMQLPDVDILPTLRLDFYQGTKIDHYLGQSLRLPVTRISPTVTVTGKTPAPAVAHFSSRGPSSVSPDILKPDLTAPGIGILAAWPPNVPPSFLPNDDRSVNWNFQSGTSQSCPHVTGTVALLKSAHPDWSPAAIRSALMTTAYTKDSTGDGILSGEAMKVSDSFDVGAGHINPIKAMNPGLIYDMKTKDYITFLCTIGYTENQISNIVATTYAQGSSSKCPKPLQSISNLNYPSITVSNLGHLTTIRRTVRNVGRRSSAIYFVSVTSPDGVEVIIWPRVLVFGCRMDEVSYYVALNPVKVSKGRYDFGEIVWSDGVHHVRSPLVVAVNNADSPIKSHFF